MPSPSLPVRPPLRRNLVLLYAGEAGAKVLGMVAFAFLGRQLGQARYGDLEFAISVLFILFLIMEAGLGPYGAREGAKRPEAVNDLARSIAQIRCVLLAVSLCVLGGIALAIDRPGDARLLVALYGLLLVPMPLLLNWAFQARDEMIVVAGATFVRQLVLACVVIGLVRGPDDAWLVPVGDATGMLCAVGIQQVLFHRRGGTLFPWKDLSHAVRVARESLPLAASSVAWALRLFFPVLALWFWSTPEATGVFAAGHRLVIALHTFVWLYFVNLLPSISRAAQATDRTEFRHLLERSLAAIAWVVTAGCLAGSLLAPALLTGVFGADFASSAQPFRILIWMLAVAFVSGHFRYGLIALGRQDLELRASLAGVAVSVVSCVALARVLTPEIAAAIVVASEAASLLVSRMQMVHAREPLPLLRPFARPLVCGALSLLAALTLAPQSPWGGAAIVLVLCTAGLLLWQPELVRALVRAPRGAGRGTST